MENQNPPNDVKDVKKKKPFSRTRLFIYLLAAVGLVWLAIQAYWGLFQFEIWLKGFGNGAFWIIGLISGFVYFYMVHKFHERIKLLPPGVKKVSLYVVFAVGVLAVNPIPISLILWLATPTIGSIHTIAYWFFLGCAVGSGIVIVLERLFAKKAPKPKKDPMGPE
jgi:hypothetical protein